MESVSEAIKAYTGNSIWQIGLLFCSIFASFLLGKFLQLAIARRSEKVSKERTVGIAALKAIASALPLLLLAIGIVYGLHFLTLGAGAQKVAHTISSVLVLIAVAHLLYLLIDVLDAFLVRKASATESKLDDMLAPIVRKSLRVTLFILVLLQLATILTSQTPASIIASLGVGGLAIAFAAQDTIKNFFGSIMLIADKPFEVGDRIVVDGFDGPVTDVGLRSTRIRTLEGHLVTIPNGRLADMSIENIGKRPHIRRILNISVTYDTPPDKVEQAVGIVRELLDNHTGMHPDFPPRVYFNDFAAASLNIIVILWFHPPDFWDYLEFTQKFNLDLLRRFNEEGIDFAFPTQTLHLAGDEKRPLEVAVLQGRES